MKSIGKYLWFSIVICSVFIYPLWSADKNTAVLSSTLSPEKLRNVLIPRAQWQPFPTWEDREVWFSLPEELRAAFIRNGEAYLNYDWPDLPATLFLEYVRNGNRSNYQAASFARRNVLCHLVLAECMEGKRRFMEDILNGIWTICEETYWGVPAHLSMQKIGHGLPDVEEPTVDLFAAETAALIAWTGYLLGFQLDMTSPLVIPRMQYELDRRILTPCLERDDFWWMGFREDRHVNNWNPWCNSNWLTAALLMEYDEERRVTTVAKIMRSLDRFLDTYPEDGGCDEGPGYWNRAGASLFDCLELLSSASDGKINFYENQKIKEIGRYIYRVHIADDYFINFADGSAKLHIAANLVYRYGTRIGDAHMAAFGAAQYSDEDLFGRGSMGRKLPAIFSHEQVVSAVANPPLPRDAWFKDTQIMMARSRQGSSKGLFVAAKGGNNAESHNHNDIGNFIVYVDGKPLIIDVGVETYTAKTFSSQRYELWTMQSAFHNLPTIDGVMQKEGRLFAARDVAYSSNDDYAQFSLDIAEAYPETAQVNKWVRTIRLDRGERVRVTETYDLKSAREIALTLMTPCNVSVEMEGLILLQLDDNIKLHIRFDPEQLYAETEDIQIENQQLLRVWGERLTRILLKSENPGKKGELSLEMIP